LAKLLLLGIVWILYWGFSQARKAQKATITRRQRPIPQEPQIPMEIIQDSQEEKDRDRIETRRKQVQKNNQNQKSNRESIPVQPAKPVTAELSILPKKKQTVWKKAWVMKEILDPPRALRPYRFRYPR
jgi:hypothetical protein